MVFVVYLQTKGVANRRMTKDVEEFLIQTAVANNSNLRNVPGMGKKRLGIRGVIRSGKGRASSTNLQFRKALGIRPEQGFVSGNGSRSKLPDGKRQCQQNLRRDRHSAPSGAPE